MNPAYASKYQTRKDKEQLTQLQAKYKCATPHMTTWHHTCGRDESSDESVTESEDEDAVELTSAVETGA